MSESRFCPVCGKEIPEDTKFVCPYCDFKLKYLEEEIVEKAKHNLRGGKAKKTMQRQKVQNNANNLTALKIIIAIISIPVYIMVGVGLYYAVYFFADHEIIWVSHEWAMLFFAVIIPGYLVIGLIVVGLILSIIISLLRKK